MLPGPYWNREPDRDKMALRLPGWAAITGARAKKDQTEQPYVMPRRILFGVLWAFLLRRQRNVWKDTESANETL